MLPVPPTRTTSIDLVKMLVPIVVEAERTGTTRAPATPQRADPTPMVIQNTFFAFIPCSPATSLFSVAARMAVPIFVFMK